MRRQYTSDDPLDEDQRDLDLLAAVGGGYGRHHYGRKPRHRRRKYVGARAVDDEFEEDDRGADEVDRLLRGRRGMAGDQFEAVGGYPEDDLPADLIPVDPETEDADLAAIGAGLDQDLGVAELTAEEQEEHQVPIKWEVSRFPFRKEVSLAELNRKRSSGIEVDFGSTYAKNKAVQDLLASSAYLGAVRVTSLRHNAPVSLAVRAESKLGGSSLVGASGASNGITLTPPNTYLASVSKPVHGLISKRQTAGAGVVLNLRDNGRVAPTWLSGYPGWSVSDLGRKVKATLEPGVQEISTDHPIAHLLEFKGLIDGQDMKHRNSVHVAQEHVREARKELETEESDNPKIGDATALRLVFVRAYGKPSAAASPDWNDSTEILDNYAKTQRTSSTADALRKSPIVIEGAWELTHGHPASDPDAAAFDEAAGL